MKVWEIINETATIGATSAGNIAGGPVAQFTKDKGYTGSPGKSGTKSPAQPKPKKQKPTDNGLDSDNLLDGVIKR